MRLPTILRYHGPDATQQGGTLTHPDGGPVEARGFADFAEAARWARAHGVQAAETPNERRTGA